MYGRTLFEQKCRDKCDCYYVIATHRPRHQTSSMEILINNILSPLTHFSTLIIQLIVSGSYRYGAHYLCRREYYSSAPLISTRNLFLEYFRNLSALSYFNTLCGRVGSADCSCSNLKKKQKKNRFHENMQLFRWVGWRFEF